MIFSIIKVNLSLKLKRVFQLLFCCAFLNNDFQRSNADDVLTTSYEPLFSETIVSSVANQNPTSKAEDEDDDLNTNF